MPLAWLRARLAEHRAFLPLLVAFSSFRLLAIFLLRHGGYLVDYGPDPVHYFAIGRLAGGGRVALFDYWMEYPPLAPWLAALAYRLSLHIPPIGAPMFVFNLVFRTLLLPFDVGTFVLVYLSADRLVGRQRALQTAGLWSLLFAPLFTLLGWFEPLPLFFLALGLYGLLSDRPCLAGLGVGLGFMAKVFPAILAPVGLFALLNGRRRAIFAASAIIATVAVILPPLVTSPTYVLATFRGFLSRNSWETVWALVEGYTGYGTGTPLDAVRMDPRSIDYAIHPARLPWLPVSLAFGLFYLFLITRRIAWHDKPRLAAFSLFSLVSFLLYSKGYSPQWTVYLSALTIIAIPDWRGLGYALLLDGLMVSEWPLAFVIMQGQGWFLAAVVVLRTALMVLLALECLARVFAARAWQSVQRLAFPVAASICLMGALAVGWPAARAYADSRLQAEPVAPLVRSLRTGEFQGDDVIVLQPGLLERLQPYLAPGTVHLYPSTYRHGWSAMGPWIVDALRSDSRAWLLYDTGDEYERPLYDQAKAWLDANAFLNQEAWYGPVRAARYVLAEAAVAQSVDVRFAGRLRLLSATPPVAPLQAGDTLGLHLEWLPEAPLAADHAIFLQVLSADGRLVAQSDIWPQPGTSHWAGGATVRTAHGLVLPPDLAPGVYTLHVGLYDASGARLPLATGGNAAELGDLVVEGPKR